MEGSERRMFLRNSGLAITAAALGDLVASNSASTQAADTAAPSPSEGPKGLTRQLAKFIVSTRFDDIPEIVRHEAKRTLLNWIGCAVGGSHEDTVSNAVAALAPFSGPGQATLFGRTERLIPSSIGNKLRQSRKWTDTTNRPDQCHSRRDRSKSALS